MTTSPTLFERRLQQNLEDPEFRAAYEREMRDIARVQDILATLDAAREEAGLSKADLARLTGAHPAAVRKLLTSGAGNPNLLSLVRMLDVTGLELRLVKAPRRGRRMSQDTPVRRRTGTATSAHGRRAHAPDAA